MASANDERMVNMPTPSTDTAKPDGKSPPPLERVRHEMDRWIDVAKATGERAMESLGLLNTVRHSTPAVDVIEMPEEVVILIDLPGVPAELVELSLTGNMLCVKAERPNRDFPEAACPRIRERINAGFERAIPLPIAVNAEAIHAETRDGLLTVSLPKVAATASHTIPVTRGSAQ